MHFKIFVKACPTFGFFVLALTALARNGAVGLIAGFWKLFQAVYVPWKFFEVYFLPTLLQVEIV